MGLSYFYGKSICVIYCCVANYPILAAANNTHLSPHGFRGSAWAGRPLRGVPREDAAKLSRAAGSSEGWADSLLQAASQFQQAVVPCHVASPLRTRQLVSTRMSNTKSILDRSRSLLESNFTLIPSAVCCSPEGSQ